MGNQCTGCCSSQDTMNVEVGQVIDNIGLDDDDVTENYQFHTRTIEKKKMHLSKYDRFYRLHLSPLYLMKIDHFLNEIEMITKNEANGTHYDEVPFIVFCEHFKKFPHWIKQLERENSSFLKMVKMKDLFLKYDKDERVEPNSIGDSPEKLILKIVDVPMEENIDVFSIKILGLLMCRG